MPIKSLSPEQIVTLLAQGPERLKAATKGLREPQLQTPPSPGEWSANEVLAHLRSCSDMWGDAIAAILAEDHPTFRAVNPRTWVEQTNYPEQKFQSNLRAFTAQRIKLLQVLEPLKPNDWQRSATVSVAGKPLERTVLFYAQWLAEHERPHLKQIARIADTFRASA
jgi:hypothetical protein